jgi:hypothetical protein
VQYLAHSASFQAGEKSAPSNSGIKHLELLRAFGRIENRATRRRVCDLVAAVADGTDPSQAFDA